MGIFLKRALVGLFRLAALALIFGCISGICWQAYLMAGEFGVAGAGALAFVATVFPAIRKTPTLQLGMVTFLGMRTGRVLAEGVSLVIPFFEGVTYFNAELQTIKVEETFFCRDRLAVIVEGTLQWRVSKSLLATAYAERRHAIPQGLSDAIRSEIGMVAGANNAVDFTGAWESISNLINCSLRMGTPPHLELGVSPEERLKFYADSNGKIYGRLRREARLAEERSEIENRYGIDVIAFSIGRIRYTPETSSAMEKEGQAVLLARGSQVTAAAKRAIVQEGKEDGLKPLEAETAAEVVMGRAERRIHNLEGLERFKPMAPPESRNHGGFLCCRTN